MFPTITQPTYTITLPMTKKELKFRPYLVKEEKILLMGLESNDSKVYLDTVKQLIDACSITKLNIEELPIIDIEYFFLHLRAKSVGEIATPLHLCKNIFNDKECNNLMKLEIDITKIQPTNIKTKEEMKIFLTGSVGVKMRYPTLNNINRKPIEDYLNVVVSCIEYVFDGDDIHYAKDNTKEDLLKFLESLSKPQFAKIAEFFDTLPIMKYETDHKCSKCGYEHHIVMEGYESFFV